MKNLKEYKRKKQTGKALLIKGTTFVYNSDLKGKWLPWAAILGRMKRHLKTYLLLNTLPSDHFHVRPSSFFSPIQCSALPTNRFKKILKKAQRRHMLNNPSGKYVINYISQKLQFKAWWLSCSLTSSIWDQLVWTFGHWS